MLIALCLMFALLLGLDAYCVYIAIVCAWFAGIGLIVLIYYCVLLMRVGLIATWFARLLASYLSVVVCLVVGCFVDMASQRCCVCCGLVGFDV